MKTLLLTALLSAFAVPAFAASDFGSASISDETPAAQEAIAEGLIPADQLDATEYQVALPQTQNVDALDRRDDRGRRDRDRRPPPRPRPEQWRCVARDRINRSFSGDGRNVNEARREAVRNCERGSIVKRCRLVGCSRR